MQVDITGRYTPIISSRCNTLLSVWILDVVRQAGDCIEVLRVRGVFRGVGELVLGPVVLLFLVHHQLFGQRGAAYIGTLLDLPHELSLGEWMETLSGLFTVCN